MALGGSPPEPPEKDPDDNLSCVCEIKRPKKHNEFSGFGDMAVTKPYDIDLYGLVTSTAPMPTISWGFVGRLFHRHRLCFPRVAIEVFRFAYGDVVHGRNTSPPDYESHCGPLFVLPAFAVAAAECILSAKVSLHLASDIPLVLRTFLGSKLC